MLFRSPAEEFDATEIVQKILNAVKTTDQRFGVNHIIQVLKGSKSQQVKKYQHEQLDVHGTVAEYSKEQLRYFIKLLIQNFRVIKQTADL